jgi:hypothetical protein
LAGPTISEPLKLQRRRNGNIVAPQIQGGFHMAQKYISVKTSDLSGVDLADGDGDTITFSVGRSSYVIDLSNDEVGAFYDALKPYTDVARKGGAAAVARAPRTGSAKQDLGAVREWASKNGHNISHRGRIPSSVMDAYNAAH